MGRAGRGVGGFGWTADPRAPLAVAVVVLLVTGLFGVTTTVASRVPSFAVLTQAPDASDSEPPATITAATASGGAATFAPLRAEFLETRLGSNLSEFFPGASPTPRGTSATGPPDGQGSGPGSDTTVEPSPTTTTTFPGPVGSPLPQHSELSVAMAADRSEVDPGDHITYTIRVTNVGTRDFRGELTIESHHPFWTTDATSPCGDSGVDPDPDEPCVNPPAPVPGTPGDDTHTARYSFGGTIEPGDSIVRQFRVRVNPGTPSGTEIENHAHLDVVGDAAAPETSDDVVVTVR